MALPTLAAAAILGIGGVGASAALSGGGNDHPSALRPAPLGTPASPITPLATTPASSPVAPSTPAAKPAPAPVPDFAITVTGRVCWVQVVGPRGHVLVAAILRHGRTLTYKQRPLTVTIGDAGAVRLVLHHRVHARAGKPGEVLRFTYR